MSLLGGLLGNATEVEISEVENELSELLIHHEEIKRAYKLIRDLFIFTNERLILIDKQGLTGKKTSYTSIPYKHISHFSLQSAGHIDLDSELLIYILGQPMPISKQLKKGANLLAIQRTLAEYVLAVT